MIILDTDVLTLVQRKEGETHQRLVARLDASGQEVVTTIVSIEEQMRGWLAYSAKAHSADDYMEASSRLRRLFEDFQTRPVLNFDDRAVAEFRRLKTARISISTMDLRIAAIVLANRATLITRNLKDFRKVSGLRAEDWSAA